MRKNTADKDRDIELALKAWDLRTAKNLSYRAIAQSLKIEQTKVFRLLRKLRDNALKLLEDKPRLCIVDQVEFLESIIEECFAAYERSKQPQKRMNLY